MPTQRERAEFGRQKAYGSPHKVVKPVNGKLVFVRKDGKEETLMNDKPFALLNAEKMRLIRGGHFFTRQLKVKYL